MPLPQPGGGGAATFPVGPKNDGTNTYEINGAAGELFVTNLLDGDGNPAALVDLQGANATSRSALISSQRDDGSHTAALSVDGGVGSFALSADDATTSFQINADSTEIGLTVTDDAGACDANVHVHADPSGAGHVELNAQNVATGGVADILLESTADPSQLTVTLDTVGTIISTPTTLTLAPATIPAADPHVVGQVYSVVGVLHISAG